MDEMLKILCRRYQRTQLYLRVGFSSPAQVSFFLISMGDSAGTSYFLPHHAKACACVVLIWHMQTRATAIACFSQSGLNNICKTVTLMTNFRCATKSVQYIIWMDVKSFCFHIWKNFMIIKYVLEHIFC